MGKWLRTFAHACADDNRDGAQVATLFIVIGRPRIEIIVHFHLTEFEIAFVKRLKKYPAFERLVSEGFKKIAP